MRRLSFILVFVCLPGLACVVTAPGSDSGPSTVTEPMESGTPQPSEEGEGESEDPSPETTAGETGDEEASTDEPGFVPDWDMSVIGCECDPFAQDCPEGEKCVPWDSASGDGIPDANKCSPVTDTKAPGEACLSNGHFEADDDCGADSYCFDLVEIGEGAWKGTCRAFCAGTADDPQCDEGHSCLLAWDGSVNLCAPSCDPLAQDCAAPSACHFGGSSGFVCVAPHQPKAAGEPCSYLNGCAAGLACLDAAVVDGCEEGSCCTPYCELPPDPGPDNPEPAPDPCASPNHSCEPFFDEPAPGYEGVGVCIELDGLP